MCAGLSPDLAVADSVLRRSAPRPQHSCNVFQLGASYDAVLDGRVLSTNSGPFDAIGILHSMCSQRMLVSSAGIAHDNALHASRRIVCQWEHVVQRAFLFVSEVAYTCALPFLGTGV